MGTRAFLASTAVIYFFFLSSLFYEASVVSFIESFDSFLLFNTTLISRFKDFSSA